MLSHGFEPKLSAAGVSAPGAGGAFVTGMRYAYLGLGACLLFGLAATLVRTRAIEADGAPQTQEPGQAAVRKR
jgi:hypothetical protein